jgi:hypothetical protein
MEKLVFSEIKESGRHQARKYAKVLNTELNKVYEK